MPRQLTKLTGVTLTGSGYTIVAPSAYELAIVKLTGLRFWMSPESRFEALGSGKGLRDRITLTDLPQFSSAGYTLGASANGQPTMNVASTGSPTFTRQAVVATGAAVTALGLGYLAGGYTKVAVVNKQTDTAYLGLLLADAKLCEFTIGGSGVSSRLEFGHGTGTGGANYTTGGISYAGSLQVILLSWDAATGNVVVEQNGVARPTAFATLPVPVPSSFTKWGFGGMDSGFTPFGVGSLGEAMVFDRPLHLAANASTKFALYAQLAAKYGISLPTA